MTKVLHSKLCGCGSAFSPNTVFITLKCLHVLLVVPGLERTVTSTHCEIRENSIICMSGMFCNSHILTRTSEPVCHISPKASTEIIWKERPTIHRVLWGCATKLDVRIIQLHKPARRGNDKKRKKKRKERKSGFIAKNSDRGLEFPPDRQSCFWDGLNSWARS